MWRWVAVVAVTCTSACGGRLLAEDWHASGCSAAGGGAAAWEDGGTSQGGSGPDRDAGATGGFHFALDGGVPWDALPMPEAGSVSDCVRCARDACGDAIDACARSEACLIAAACGAMGCPDPENSLCPTQCSAREPAAVLASAMVLACLVEQCEQVCQSGSALGDAFGADGVRGDGSGAAGLEE
jgi:hypothetical protein